MNPVNELSLGLKHLKNAYGSCFFTGASREQICACIGCLSFVASLYGSFDHKVIDLQIENLFNDVQDQSPSDF